MQKIDLSKFWAHLPSRDIEETAAARRPAASPSVHIGTVAGDAITLNVMGGRVDMASPRTRRKGLVQQAGSAEEQDAAS